MVGHLLQNPTVSLRRNAVKFGSQQPEAQTDDRTPITYVPIPIHTFSFITFVGSSRAWQFGKIRTGSFTVGSFVSQGVWQQAYTSNDSPD